MVETLDIDIWINALEPVPAEFHYVPPHERVYDDYFKVHLPL